jgi:hypothetical protein
MSNRNTLLVLEDNDERILGFESALSHLVPRLELKVWFDAPTMISELPLWFDQARLFSLDHDLVPRSVTDPDSGTGLEVAEFLARHAPVCPVLIHSSNTDRAWSMHNELRFAGWNVDRIGPIGADWIETLWLSKVRTLLSK